jgi:hypothetical protein
LSGRTQYADAANRLLNALRLSSSSRQRLSDIAIQFEGDDLPDDTVGKIGRLADDILQILEISKAEASKSKVKVTVQRWSGELVPYLRLALEMGKCAIELVPSFTTTVNVRARFPGFLA